MMLIVVKLIVAQIVKANLRIGTSSKSGTLPVHFNRGQH